MFAARTQSTMLRSIAAARPVAFGSGPRFFSISPGRLNATDSISSSAVKPSSSITSDRSDPLPYYIHRSKTNNLPVYQELKAQGPKKQTRIRKTEGNLDVLRNHLVEGLANMGVKKEDVTINHLNKHVIIKGHYRREIIELLQKLGF